MEGGEFGSTALKVWVLAVDSTGKHETGEVERWQNRITLKSRDYVEGESRRVEIRAAPTATIFYTTDGSSPLVGGQPYTEPVIIDQNVRLVQAVAKSDGIVSDVHAREIPPKPVDRPIKKNEPAVWTPDRGLEFPNTHSAYGFIGRLKKYARAASGLRIEVQAGDDQWSELCLADRFELSGDRVEQSVEHLREIVTGSAIVEIRAKRIHFDTGQQLLNYMTESRTDYKRDEVEP